MVDNIEKNKLIFERIVLFFLLTMLIIVNELTEIKFDLEWFKDIDVWINDFFVNTFVFFFMSTLLSKVSNKYMEFGISYVISVLLGNFIELDTSNLNITPLTIILVVLNIATMIAWGWNGYNKGKRKAEKQLIETKHKYVQQVLQLDERTRTELYKLSDFIKKYPKECGDIDRFGIDFVMQFIEDDREIRKVAKNDPRNKTTN